MKKAARERGEHKSHLPKFEDSGAWHLGGNHTHKVNEREVTLNGEP